MWCLVIRLASPSLSLTLVTNRISLLLFHVLPHASQAASLCKQRLWSVASGRNRSCVVCVVHDKKAKCLCLPWQLVIIHVQNGNA